MKKIIFLLSAIFCLTMAQIAYAQAIDLTFKGSTTNGKYVQLDSVQVENLNRNWTETLVYPDTVLSFPSTGIEDAQTKSIDGSLVAYPNPFNGITRVSLIVSQSEEISLQVYNIAGQRIMGQRVQAEVGENLFEISLQHTQVYFLIINTSKGRMVEKLINLSNSGENSIVSIGTNPSTATRQTKSQKMVSSKEFQLGDVLRIKGFITHNGNIVLSDEILQAQRASENFTLFFTLPDGLVVPTVTTTAVSNISSTTATAGGNVTSDGGAAVTARGVCWSTTQNPTISNNHTTDGSGTGNFTSSLTGLTAGTTYYVRAYATNAVGTAYGNEITFTTTVTTFSVSATQKVVFSPGNLQWSATNGGNTATTHTVAGGSTAAGTWRFAPNQWDTIGANNKNISSTYSGWIDLFGWGTSGWDSGAKSYQPWSAGTDSDDANKNYGVGNSCDLTGDYANADWGVYNTFKNGANRNWRTPTANNFDCLFSKRTNATKLFAVATANNVRGLILLPDSIWNAGINNFKYEIKDSIFDKNSNKKIELELHMYINGTDTIRIIPYSNSNKDLAWDVNIYSAEQWEILENNLNAVFLPAAGYRDDTYVNRVNNCGYYWTSIHCGNTDDINYSPFAYNLLFSSNSVNTSNYMGKFNGNAVRLISYIE